MSGLGLRPCHRWNLSKSEIEPELQKPRMHLDDLSRWWNQQPESYPSLPDYSEATSLKCCEEQLYDTDASTQDFVWDWFVASWGHQDSKWRGRLYLVYHWNQKVYWYGSIEEVQKYNYHIAFYKMCFRFQANQYLEKLNQKSSKKTLAH